MKFTIFAFLLLQIVVWTLHFSGNGDKSNLAYLSDTWEVAEVMDYNNENEHIILHFPTFNRLTLNTDGTFHCKKIDGSFESGKWKLNATKTYLSLNASNSIEIYEIIQLPDKKGNLFIIKEGMNGPSFNKSLSYRLTRV